MFIFRSEWYFSSVELARIYTKDKTIYFSIYFFFFYFRRLFSKRRFGLPFFRLSVDESVAQNDAKKRKSTPFGKSSTVNRTLVTYLYNTISTEN